MYRHVCTLFVTLFALFMGVPPALPPEVPDVKSAAPRQAEQSVPKTNSSGVSAPLDALTSPAAPESPPGRLHVDVQQPTFDPAAPQPGIVTPQRKKNPLDF